MFAQVLLADDVTQRLRAQALGQGDVYLFRRACSHVCKTDVSVIDG
jgi:hypothetical protein